MNRKRKKKMEKQMLALLVASILTAGNVSPGVVLPVQAAENTNLALNKDARASNELAASSEHPSRTANLAVDGKGDNSSENINSRWQSGDPKEFKEEWLEIDLGKKTNVSSVVVKFFAKLCGDFVIETASTNNDETQWRMVREVTNITPTDTANLVKTVDLTSEGIPEKVERYIRLRFTSGNENAMTRGISIYEFEVYGTFGEITEQPDKPNIPETSKEAIQQIEIGAIDASTKIVPLTGVPKGFKAEVIGSEYPQVVMRDGTISDYNMYDYHNMEIMVQVTKDDHPEDVEKKTFKIHVPKKNTDLIVTAEQPNKEPQVIPSVQEWSGGTGYTKLSNATRIIVNDQANVDIQKISKQFQQDMKEITGWNFEIVSGESGDSDDIVFESMVEDTYDIGKEGYVLKADDNGIHVYVKQYSGCYYGAMTLEQVFYPQTGEFKFPKGTIRDFSKYEVRGVMVDIARAPYRIDVLNDLVKMFSFYKINEVHFHLNDNRHIFENEGRNDYEKWKNVESMFRLESESFPSLKSTSKGNEYFNSVYGGSPQYTKAEYKALQQFAVDCAINPLSEIDAPGHSLPFNRYVKENLSEAKKGVEEQIGEPLTGAIHSDKDWELLAVTGEKGTNAKNFMKALFQEYLSDEVFVGETVGIGADEYWGANPGDYNIPKNEQEGVRSYIRELADQIQKDGKNVRMWGSTNRFFASNMNQVKEYKDIQLDCWSKEWDNAAERIKDGFKVVNVDSYHLYGNPGRDKRDIVNVEHIFNNWDPTVKNINGKIEKSEPNLLGAKTALWADVADMGVTERDNIERLMRQAAVLSEKTWGGTDEEQTFEEYSFKFEKLKTGTGVELGSDIPAETGLVLNYDFKNVKDGTVSDTSGNDYDGIITNGVVVEKDGKNWLDLNGNSSIKTKLRSIDYPYTIQFDLKVDEKKEGQLFDSRDGRLFVKDGKIHMNRSYFEDLFDYTVLKDQPQKITIVGTSQVTKLYVDGVFQQALTRTSSSENDFEHRLSTFVFPLTTIGEGLEGEIADLKVYNKALSPQIIKDISENKVVTEVNVAQDQATAGTAQRKGDTGQDVDWKKLRVGWKATDGDGNTLDGRHGTEVSEKDSYFEGAYADSKLAVDMLEQCQISKVVLQWDRAPKQFKLQKSEDGNNWTDIGVFDGEIVNTINFDRPIATRYLKMQGVALNGTNTFKLREFEAYERVNKEGLKKQLDDSKKKYKESNISYGDVQYQSFFNALAKAEALYESALTVQGDAEAAKKILKTETDALTIAKPPVEPEEKPPVEPEEKPPVEPEEKPPVKPEKNPPVNLEESVMQKEDTIPQTGDLSDFLLYLEIAIASGVIVLVLKKKRV